MEHYKIMEVIKSNLCDYNNAYILGRGDITVTASLQIQVAFKHCVPFTKYITKIDGTRIDDAENLDLVMPMHNLLEYSSNYSERKDSYYGFILKMKQLILMQILLMIIILNLLNIKLNY